METKSVSVQQRSRLKLGEILIKAKLITQEQIDSALTIQKNSGKKIGKILIEMGAITEKQLCETLGFQLGVPFVDLEHTALDPRIVNLIPEPLAGKHTLIAIDKSPDGIVSIAMVNPLDVIAIDDIKAATGLNVRVMISMQSVIEKAIDEYYKIDELIFNKLKEVMSTEHRAVIGKKKKEEPEDIAQALSKAQQAPVTRLLDFTLADAIKDNASDIHIEPQIKNVAVRFRIDGILHDRLDLPKYTQESLIARVKIISELNISEKRAPQDGRARINLHDREIDLRVSTLPTIYGEKAVIRILDKTKLPLNLKELGIDDDTHKVLDSFLQNTKGMIFVTGPTGSGKTTTLYAALGQIKTRAKNIVTVENPVEYAIDGINQVQTNERVGVTFASGLRSILRQDPDVILVGEVRDRETAQIAFDAALTGHLVLSTVHTDSAAGAIIRLLELDIDPYLISETIIGIIAQRLVRRVCENCKALCHPPKDLLDMLGLKEKDVSGKKIYKTVGCNMCNNTGYKGRIAIFEIIKMEPEIRGQITSKISEKALIDIGKMTGMKTLRESGMEKAFAGITTLEEVLRVTYEEKETVFSCPRCARTLEQSFSICPYCQQNLIPKKCPQCAKMLNPIWQICPYCRATS